MLSPSTVVGMAAERQQKLQEAIAAVSSEELLPNAIDIIAKFMPERIYAEQPLSVDSFDAGFRTVTYKNLANAVNGVAWWLHNSLGSSTTCESLCYMGPNDLARNLVLLGACKAGYSTLMMTPRFNAIAHGNFISRCNCDKIIIPEGPAFPETEVLNLYTKCLRVPNFEELFDQEHEPYESKKTFAEAKLEPLIILHTSGTTGFPKPVVWCHEYVASCVKERRLQPPRGYESTDGLLLGGKLICSFPPTHAGPSWITLLHTTFCGSSMVYLLSGSLSDANMIRDCVKHKIDGIMVTPPLP